MNKQVVIIGLGQFGTALSKALVKKGIEVLAIDRKEENVNQVANFVTEAVCFDATDAEALAQVRPREREACVCAIGDESRESSIICTALLRQMGAQRVIARANDDIHSRILSLVGAHEVINPEKEFGERYASQIIHGKIVGELPLGDNLIITEFRPPQSFLGKSLIDLKLPTQYDMNVVAVRQKGSNLKSVVLPRPDKVINEDDVLVVVSTEKAVMDLMEANHED